ncbi:MAG TPA: SCO2521 family protein [Rugosimonospora sp.]|nr:SCO2521 family protein [Rugosimonospora sp.]
MLALGEVHTGLLQNSASLSKIDAAGLLDLVMGERVRASERPIDYVASPERLFGVDCTLATASRSHVRGVGTVATRTTMTGGHVVQGSAYAWLRPSATTHRLAWSHYLGRPGVVETIGRAEPVDLAAGFVQPDTADRVLDLGAICARSLDDVQRSPALDRRIALRTTRTRLRWAVTGAAGEPEADAGVRFTVESPTLRTLRIEVAAGAAPAVVALCEDLALHDWLLTTLLAMIDRNLTYGAVGPRSVQRLRPAIDHLLHLWMPAARVEATLLPVWESVERRPGFTRQWQACVSRIRDQVTVSALALLGGER